MSDPASRPDLDLELAKRLQRALTASAEGLYDVLGDPAMEVLRTALRNPELAAEHLLALLRRHDLAEEIPKAIWQQDRIELSHPLQLALVRNPRTPTPIRLTLLPNLRLFELVDLLFLPWATPDQKLAAERQVVKRLPQLPLGHKLTLARRASAHILGELLREGTAQVMELCLSNPHLKEAAIHQFLAGPTARAETISAIARHPRWKNRPHLRLAILKHPQTPAIWHHLWLKTLPLHEVRNLLASRQLKAPQKQAVAEELARRQTRRGRA